MKTKKNITIVFQQDLEGYIHIKVKPNIPFKDQFSTDTLTISKKQAKLPTINSMIVFLKEDAISLLSKNKIIDKVFKSKGGEIWCGIINKDIYFKIEDSFNKKYIHTITIDEKEITI
ncbi:hypothetical protein COJ50_21630 [Bacillus cereus]|uniref:Uncharacterized protein n=2 Tax=Bacillus cereus TaxID=1396 RepID=A0A2B1KAP3_BACCE|nr:hypothetical protein COJ50_21630 [Bacillus cereus]